MKSTINQIQKTTKNYPRFEDGRIDYTDERVCFVLNCVIVYKDQVLLTKRSADVIAYPNTINGVSGFIDQTDISIEDLARNELSEELEAPLNKLTKLIVSQPFIQNDPDINREWHVYAVLVEFSKKFQPKTNWENKTAKWFDITSIHEMQLMRGFPETVNIALSLK
jgi:isopentenyldiphosphate isomerase